MNSSGVRARGGTRIVLAALAGIALCGCSSLGQTDAHVVQAPTVLKVGDDTLPCGRWLATGHPSAIVLAVHGLNDYHNAFEGFGRHMAAQGVAVYAYDQRGFGAAPGRGTWPGADTLSDDLRQAVLRLRRIYPDTPMFLLGDSMGAAVAVVTLRRWPRLPVEGLVLSSPALVDKAHLGRVRTTALAVVASLFPWMTVSRPDGVTVTRDEALAERLGHDPLVLHETRLEVLHGLVELMDQAAGEASRLELPLLVLFGMRDEVIPLEGIRHTLDSLRAPVTTRFYEDGYHLLLREKQAAVWNDILSWLRELSPPAVMARVRAEAQQ